LEGAAKRSIDSLMNNNPGVSVSSIEQQRNFYQDKWASYKHANRLELQRMAKVLEYLCEVSVRDAICDLGCGAGWTTAILGYFGRTLGVELSGVDRQRELYGHCEFLSADVLEWEAPEGAFDVVASIEVIEHIVYPKQSLYLGVARRLLKPNGYLILTTPNKRTMRAMRNPRAWTNQPVEDWLDMPELLALLQENGFDVVRKSSLILGYGEQGSYRIANSAKLTNLLTSFGLLNRFQRWLLKRNFGLHLVVLAKRRSI
jgi:2-polyprenyl-3-methyl-5-hydroxy-6-metoxy-1,4-benzoquinol methylase